MSNIGTPVETRDIPTIKAWRKQRHDAGLPSGFNDFYTVNGLCLRCRGAGVLLRWSGACLMGEDLCSNCNGTGKTS